MIITGVSLVLCAVFTFVRKGSINTFSTANILAAIVLMIISVGIEPGRPGLPPLGNAVNPAGHIMIAQEVERAGGYQKRAPADESFWYAGVTLLLVGIILKVIF